MRFVFIVVGVLVAAALAVLTIGLVLPATRQATAERVLPAPASLVAQVVLDVTSQPQWRTGLASVQVVDGGWIETLDSREVVTFRLGPVTPDRIEMSFESTLGYHGTWTGEMIPQADGTLLRATESATTPSPVGRMLSRLFFDPRAHATEYLGALEAEVARRGAAS